MTVVLCDMHFSQTKEVADDMDARLLNIFPETNKFIDEGRQSGGVLVHCMYGVSRSSTCVCAYLMSKEGVSYEQALDMLRFVKCMESLLRACERACVHVAHETTRGVL